MPPLNSNMRLELYAVDAVIHPFRYIILCVEIIAMYLSTVDLVPFVYASNRFSGNVIFFICFYRMDNCIRMVRFYRDFCQLRIDMIS